MRTRSEYLIQKRDGRLQNLRAAKLARSLRLALRGPAAAGGDALLAAGELAAGELTDGDVLACELAEAILKAIGAVSGRGRARGIGGLGGGACAGTSAPVCRISARQLAEVAVGALRQCGHADAAERFLAHRAAASARERDRQVLRAARDPSAWAVLPSAPGESPPGRR